MGHMRPWRDLGVRRATAHDAVTQGLALLDDSAAPTVVRWEVDGPSLVLSQGSRVDADTVACAAAGVDVVRRGSGGGPVLWTKDLLAFDVFVPRDHPLWSADVVEAYRWLGELFADVLSGQGVRDVRAVTVDQARELNDPELARLACYGGVSPWEVLVGGRKVVGLSQVRRRSGVLLQVGILGSEEWAAVLPHLLAIPADQRGELTARLLACATSLAAVDVDPGDLASEVTSRVVALG